MHQPNAIGRAQETIDRHESRIELINKKREILLEKIKKMGRADQSTSLLHVEQVRMLEQERSDLMSKIKTLRNTCRQADSVEAMVSTQQHLDDLNLYMVQSMGSVGIERVKGINKDSEKIAQDIKKFSLYSSMDQNKEEQDNEESRRYLEDLLSSCQQEEPPQQQQNKVPQTQQKNTLTLLDDLMGTLK